jgi:hypothetical protein
MEIDTDLITMREAADICRFKGVEAIRAAIRRRELPAIKINHRHMVIPRQAFYKWLKGRYLRAVDTSTNQLIE